MAGTDPVAATLSGIRAIEQAATPGPWRLEWDSCDCGDGYGCSHGSWPHAIHTPRAHTERPDGDEWDHDFSHTEISDLGDADAEFIIAARTAFPLLLAAVEAALKLADDWDAEARGILLEAARTADAGEVGAASALQSSAADLRAAITAELAGTQPGEDGNHG